VSRGNAPRGSSINARFLMRIMNRYCFSGKAICREASVLMRVCSVLMMLLETPRGI
jgi:hypothetical protein